MRSWTLRTSEDTTCSVCDVAIPAGSILRSHRRCLPCKEKGIAKCEGCEMKVDETTLSRNDRCQNCRYVHLNRNNIIHPTLPWLEDFTCRALVVHHPDGMTLEEVGTVMGVSRERVRQIERNAKEKLRHLAKTENLEESLVSLLFHVLNRDDEAAAPQAVLPARSRPPVPAVSASHESESEMGEAALEVDRELTSIEQRLSRALPSYEHVLRRLGEPDVE